MRWAEGKGNQPTVLSHHTDPFVSNADVSASLAIQWYPSTHLPDTHQAVNILCEAGAAEPLAEAFVETIGDVITGNVATKADIADAETDLEAGRCCDQSRHPRIRDCASCRDRQIRGYPQSRDYRNQSRCCLRRNRAQSRHQ